MPNRSFLSIVAFALTLLAPALATTAAAQGAIQQSGPVTSYHVPSFSQNGVVVDGGSPAGPAVGSLGLFNGSACPFGVSSQTSPGVSLSPYAEFSICQTPTTTTLVLTGANGEPTPTLYLQIGSSLYPFPGPGNGNVIGPASSTVGDAACFNSGGGTLLYDCGRTGTGNVAVFSTSPSLTTPVLGAATGTSLADSSFISAGAGTGYRIGGTDYVLRDDLAGNLGLGFGSCFVTTSATGNLCAGYQAGGSLADLATNFNNTFAGFEAGKDLNMPGSGAVVSCSVSGGVIQSPCTVSAGGSGYTQAPYVEASPGGGINGVLAATVSGGAVTAVTAVSGGTGYSGPFAPTIHGVDSNVAIGVSAMEGFGVTGYSMYDDIAIGPSAMAAAYGQTGSIAIGHNVLYGANGGIYDTFVGDAAGEALTTGGENSGFARGALYMLTTGSFNNAQGHAAGGALTTGSYNVFSGDIACDTDLVTGSDNTCIGAETAMTGDYSNSTVLGFGATATGSHQVVLGTTSELTYASGGLQVGPQDAASPAPQALRGQGVLAGTSNTAGTALSILAGPGTGTGAGGSLLLQTAPAGSSGTTQNSAQTVLDLDANSHAGFLSPSEPTVSSCGTGSPAVATGSTDVAAAVTTGTSATTCTLTFKIAYTAAPFCVVQDKTVVADLTSYTISTAAIVLTMASNSGDVVEIICHGN